MIAAGEDNQPKAVIYTATFQINEIPLKSYVLDGASSPISSFSEKRKARPMIRLTTADIYVRLRLTTAVRKMLNSIQRT